MPIMTRRSFYLGSYWCKHTEKHPNLLSGGTYSKLPSPKAVLSFDVWGLYGGINVTCLYSWDPKSVHPRGDNQKGVQT